MKKNSWEYMANLVGTMKNLVLMHDMVMSRQGKSGLGGWLTVREITSGRIVANLQVGPGDLSFIEYEAFCRRAWSLTYLLGQFPDLVSSWQFPRSIRDRGCIRAGEYLLAFCGDGVDHGKAGAFVTAIANDLEWIGVNKVDQICRVDELDYIIRHPYFGLPDPDADFG